MASSFSASSRLSRAFSFSSSLGPLGCLCVLLGPILVEPPVPGRFGDLELLDDLDHRAPVVEHFLALPDFGDDLLRVRLRAVIRGFPPLSIPGRETHTDTGVLPLDPTKAIAQHSAEETLSGAPM
jgi:hypothetical protein